MNVSVIIPACNAAETIAETLESICSQTFGNWEAVVVINDSSDETDAVVTGFSKRDSRIRTVSQSQKGVSAARNTGLSLARFEWILFLDADDWIAPSYFEQMMAVLSRNPTLDAVNCGWARVASDGTTYRYSNDCSTGDIFSRAAHVCPFAIHACIVRRALIQSVGGFDISLSSCEDWDLWQRIARTGARFAAVNEILAFYRVRPGSSSTDGVRLLTDGLQVLTQGYSPDPRVMNPKPSHAEGLSRETLSVCKIRFASWCAGLLLGRNQDALPLLSLLDYGPIPQLEPAVVGRCIFEAGVLPGGLAPVAWIKLWPQIGRRIDAFLLALEEHLQHPGLARYARASLEREILDHASTLWPQTIGATHAVRIELTESIPDIFPPALVERLLCSVELKGRRIGTVILPALYGPVYGPAIAKAITHEFTRVFLRPSTNLSKQFVPNVQKLKRNKSFSERVANFLSRVGLAVLRLVALSLLVQGRLRNRLNRSFNRSLPSSESSKSELPVDKPWVTEQLPILMYHRIASSGLPDLARYRVTPEAFEEQLRYLKDAGFYSIKLEDWHAAVQARKALPERAVLITFDDGYLDFQTYAWPLLKRYGFSATVFLVSGNVGQFNSWDQKNYKEEVPLLGWEDILQLQREGVEFGCHSVSHGPMTKLSIKEVMYEGTQAQLVLERALGKKMVAFAYPYGDVDWVVQHLIEDCGYTFGLSCRSGKSAFQDSLIALPRIEIKGSDCLQEFIRKLHE